MTLLTVQQFFRYLYVFNWKLVAELNEIFWANFLTMLVYLLSFMSAFASIYSGHHQHSIDFHLCIGRDPSWDITDRIQGESRFKDPIHVFSFVTFSVIFALFIKILVYSHKNTILKTLKSCLEGVKLNALADRLPVNGTSAGGPSPATAILELYADAGPYLAIAVFAFGMLIYSNELRESQTGASFNAGPGRALTFLSKVLISFMSTVLLPLMVIINNAKMRQSVWKRLKQANIFRWAQVSFIQEDLQMVST